MHSAIIFAEDRLRVCRKPGGRHSAVPTWLLAHGELATAPVWMAPPPRRRTGSVDLYANWQYASSHTERSGPTRGVGIEVQAQETARAMGPSPSTKEPRSFRGPGLRSHLARRCCPLVRGARASGSPRSRSCCRWRKPRSPWCSPQERCRRDWQQLSLG